MGTVLKKKTMRPIPVGAEIVTRAGQRLARWRVRGKIRTAPVNEAGDRITTESAT